MNKLTSILRRLPLLALVIGLLAVAPAAHAAIISFPDLNFPATAPTTPLTTSATSNLGLLNQSTVLTFTLTTTGGTYESDFNVTITVPSGQSILYTHPLPGAANGPGTYTGTLAFPAGSQPSSGLYSLTFQNSFNTALAVTLSGISLTVTQAAVPEPSTWAMALGGAGLLGFMVVRRRRLARQA